MSKKGSNTIDKKAAFNFVASYILKWDEIDKLHPYIENKIIMREWLFSHYDDYKNALDAGYFIDDGSFLPIASLKWEAEAVKLGVPEDKVNGGCDLQVLGKFVKRVYK